MREYTNRIVQLIENDCLNPTELSKQLLMWLSESEAKEFYFANGYDEYFEEEEDE